MSRTTNVGHLVATKFSSPGISPRGSDVDYTTKSPRHDVRPNIANAFTDDSAIQAPDEKFSRQTISITPHIEDTVFDTSTFSAPTITTAFDFLLKKSDADADADTNADFMVEQEQLHIQSRWLADKSTATNAADSVVGCSVVGCSVVGSSA